VLQKSENARLKQEVDTLKKQLANKTIAETPIKGDEMHTKMRTLERDRKTLKSDKVQLNEQLSSLREQLSSKDKELKELKGECREAGDEITRLRDK